MLDKQYFEMQEAILTPNEWTPDITKQVIKCDNKMSGGEKSHDSQTIQNI